LLNYGLLHEDLFFETGGEFFGVWEQVKTVLPQFREQFSNPTQRPRLKGVVPIVNTCGRRETFKYVLMCDYCRPWLCTHSGFTAFLGVAEIMV
jgi:hypothetical protein